MGRPGNRLSRRDFVLHGAATLGAMGAATKFAQGFAQAGNRNILHIIGYSHIDAAWLWPWRDGSDTVLTTFRSALNRIEETPGFCYSHSSSAHYRWVERTDPEMLSEIKQRIREGRWEVVGGWPVEPDCNIPATESFVRHSLYGKAYCRSVLGAEVKIGFNPDSFGHAAGLPAILKRAGYGYYVFMRPQEHEMNLPLLFWWESADGSRVLTLRIWNGYDRGANMIRPAATAAFAAGFDHGAFFLGVGDHGGAVTKEQIQQILALQKDSSLPQLRFSTLRDFFAAVESSPAFASLPVVRTELQHHARGCYSAYGEGKFLNRRAERWLGEAEVISVVANLSAGRAYPADQYAEAWWKVLFCQFHDMMAGTSLYSDYRDVRDSVGYACEVAQTSKVEALEMMAKRVDMSSVEESAVFVFNPLPWRRKALLEYYAEQGSSREAPITRLSSKEGQRVPVQWRPSDSMTNFFPRLSAWVELPPCGYKVFTLERGDPPPVTSYSNSVTVSDSGFGISSLKAEDGKELLSGSVGMVVVSDTSDTWAHGINQFRQEMGRPTLVSSAVVENGPVTRVTRHRASWQNSEIILDIAEFAGLDFVELRFVIDWHEHEQMLMLEVPTALEQPKIYAKVPGQVLERSANGEEEPYQDWAAVQGRIGDGEYTVAVLNNSTYSYDCLHSLFRTVLIRSAPFARHNPNQVPHDDNNAWQDQGRQERRFWLLRGRGAYTELALDRRAEELQTPAEYVMDSAHHGTQSWEQSFLEVMPANVWILAIKRAEGSSQSTILRLQERSGKTTQATLKSTALGLDQTVSLAPWEIKTLLISPAKTGRSDIREVSLLEV
ncbi:MAG: glycoside hydrolase family 38 C-terminal domain-containing protein [Acidobacteriaceae bacterium]